MLLGLSELGEVECGNLLGVLNLPLVGPGLVLQLLGQLAQLLEPLAVLLTPKFEFADFPVRSQRRLVSFSRPSGVRN